MKQLSSAGRERAKEKEQRGINTLRKIAKKKNSTQMEILKVF